MNAEDDESMRRPWWALLAFISVILAWAHVPKDPGRRRTVFIAIKGIGIAALIALLAIYRRDAGATDLPFIGEVTDYRWLHTEWWEILGLIGWAYLGGSIIYLLVGKRREWLVGAVGLLMVLYLADRQGGLLKRVDKKAWLEPLAPAIHNVAHFFDWLGSGLSLDVMFGSLSAIVVAGCVLGTILLPASDVATPRARIKWALGYAAGLFVAGLLTDCFAGINKNGATPAWCFFCSALTCADLDSALRDHRRLPPPHLAHHRRPRRRQPAHRLPHALHPRLDPPAHRPRHPLPLPRHVEPDDRGPRLPRHGTRRLRRHRRRRQNRLPHAHLGEFAPCHPEQREGSARDRTFRPRQTGASPAPAPNRQYPMT